MIESIPDASADNLEDVTLEIPDDIPSVNEVEHFISQHNGKKLNAALFCCLSGVVGNHTKADLENGDKYSLYTNVGITTIQTMDSYPTKLHAQQDLFGYLPGKTWPVAFREYMNVLQEIEPPLDFFPPENIN